MDPQTLPGQSNVAYTASQPSGMFSGRLGRWGYLLATILLTACLFIPFLLEFFLHLNFGTSGNVNHNLSASVNVLSVLLGLIFVVLFIPVGLSINIRRWHDLGQSGWFVLLSFVPFLSLVVSLIMLFVPGTKGPNRYGERFAGSYSPKKLFFNR